MQFEIKSEPSAEMKPDGQASQKTVVSCAMPFCNSSVTLYEFLGQTLLLQATLVLVHLQSEILVADIDDTVEMEKGILVLKPKPEGQDKQEEPLRYVSSGHLVHWLMAVLLGLLDGLSVGQGTHDVLPVAPYELAEQKHSEIEVDLAGLVM
jgi:hypothetical protein